MTGVFYVSLHWYKVNVQLRHSLEASRKSFRLDEDKKCAGDASAVDNERRVEDILRLP